MGKQRHNKSNEAVRNKEADYHADFKQFSFIEISLSESCRPQGFRDFQVANHCFNKYVRATGWNITHNIE